MSAPAHDGGGRPGLQRIEPMEVPPRPRVQTPGGGSVPPPAAPPTPAMPAQPSADPPVRTATRFTSAAAALSYAGHLTAVGRGAGITVLHSAEPAANWWVAVEIDIELGRQLSRATTGVLFVDATDGLVQDPGWGPAPRIADDGPHISTEGLTQVPLVTLVRVAGLHRVPPRPVDELHILLDGGMLHRVLRRALDMGLRTHHRPVRLRALFPTETGGPGEHSTAPAGVESLMIELTLRAPNGSIASGFVLSLLRDPTLVACRVVGDGNLLVQHGAASPLADHLLANLVDTGTWVLLAAPFGSWRLEPLGDAVDSASLVRLAHDYPLEPAGAPVDGLDVTPPVLEVVPRRTPDRSVDAVMLDNADLGAVRFVLEGHDLAEIAMLVRGRDRHLLLAPGGVLERLPIGVPLFCVGPGPLYLPLGHGLRPAVPATARRELFGADEHTAVVLMPQAGIVFDLDRQDPAWTAWIGDLPPVEMQLSQAREVDLEALDSLVAEGEPPAETDEKPPAPPKRRRGWRWRRRAEEPESWAVQAFRAEAGGNLVEAAEIHLRNGSVLRAAALFERAGRAAGS